MALFTSMRCPSLTAAMVSPGQALAAVELLLKARPFRASWTSFLTFLWTDMIEFLEKIERGRHRRGKNGAPAAWKSGPGNASLAYTRRVRPDQRAW